MEGRLENPVTELKLCLLGLRHLVFILFFVNFYLAAHLNKLFNGCFVFRYYESIADVLRDPIFFGSLQVLVHLLIVFFQLLCECMLAFDSHRAAAAALGEALGLCKFI